VTLSFIPYRLLQWCPQSKEILLNLTSVESNYSRCTGRTSENICIAAAEALRKKVMKLSLSPKLVEKLVWVPIILFCKFSFSVTHLMPYYAETGHSCPLIT
jgi:hypothetical protein